MAAPLRAACSAHPRRRVWDDGLFCLKHVPAWAFPLAALVVRPCAAVKGAIVSRCRLARPKGVTMRVLHVAAAIET